eukprot:gnl/MRDRNA2_/MRDRNA2_129697_c0_seq1.p1 gnl/MRDRNA2_/MRDRNA2_129697_c0~~gnl/MRDRNA2_/MRDRNA2_129697_c0_seq1.p1  ORF type:complete len:231 (+),score=43.42 gnl/MRDRNA2_/MRDRNA2_129697_c0_seq1:57-749(+)
MKSLFSSSILLCNMTHGERSLQNDEAARADWHGVHDCVEKNICATCIRPGFAEIKTCHLTSTRVDCSWTNQCSCHGLCKTCDAPSEDACRTCREGYLLQDEHGVIHVQYDGLGTCVIPPDGEFTNVSTHAPEQLPDAGSLSQAGDTAKPETHDKTRDPDEASLEGSTPGSPSSVTVEGATTTPATTSMKLAATSTEQADTLEDYHTIQTVDAANAQSVLPFMLLEMLLMH